MSGSYPVQRKRAEHGYLILLASGYRTFVGAGPSHHALMGGQTSAVHKRSSASGQFRTRRNAPNPPLQAICGPLESGRSDTAVMTCLGQKNSGLFEAVQLRCCAFHCQVYVQLTADIGAVRATSLKSSLAPNVAGISKARICVFISLRRFAHAFLSC